MGGMGGMGAVGAMPMAGLGQATMVGSVSAPPSWAGSVTPGQAYRRDAASDCGLDRRGAAGCAGDIRARRARNGLGRAQLRRLWCAALRRQAHRHAKAGRRLGGRHRRSRTNLTKSEIRTKGTEYRMSSICSFAA